MRHISKIILRTFGLLRSIPAPAANTARDSAEFGAVRRGADREELGDGVRRAERDKGVQDELHGVISNVPRNITGAKASRVGPAPTEELPIDRRRARRPESDLDVREAPRGGRRYREQEEKHDDHGIPRENCAKTARGAWRARAARGGDRRRGVAMEKEENVEDWREEKKQNEAETAAEAARGASGGWNGRRQFHLSERRRGAERQVRSELEEAVSGQARVVLLDYEMRKE